MLLVFSCPVGNDLETFLPDHSQLDIHAYGRAFAMELRLRSTPLGSADRAKQRQPELLRESRDLGYFLAYTWLWPPQRE